MNKTNSTLSLVLLAIFSSSCKMAGSGSAKIDFNYNKKVFYEVATISPGTANFNPLPASMAVQFPDKVDMSSVSISDFQVTGTGACLSSPVLSVTSVGRTSTVLLDTASCAHGDTVKVDLDMKGVQSVEGAIGSGMVSHTYTLNTDNAPTPSINLSSGPVNLFPGTFSILYDNLIDMTSVTADMFDLQGSGGCASDPYRNLTIFGHTATVHYDPSGCVHGDSITVQVNNSTLKDSTGRSGAGTVQRVLTLDTIGVSSSEVSLNHAPGDINPLPNTLTISFPPDVRMDSVSLSDFIVYSTGSCSPTPLTGLTINGQDAVLSFNTAGCQNGDSLSFMHSLASISDHAGNPGTGVLNSSWRYINALPAEPTWSILAGTVQTLPTNLQLTFSDSVNLETVTTSSVRATGTGSCPVQPFTSLVKSSPNATLALSTTGCSHGDSITVTVDMSQISNTVGLLGTGSVSKTFTLDGQGPMSPVFNVDTGSFAQFPGSIQLIFGSDTNMSTVNTSTILVSGRGACPTNALSNLSITGKTATLTLSDSGCADNDRLELKVLLSQITDDVGNSGLGSVVKTLTLDTSAPAVPVVNLATGPMTVLPTNIQFQFDQSINMSTVDSTDFIVQGSGSCLTSPLTNFQILGRDVSLTLDPQSCSSGDSLIVTLDMTGIQNTTSVAGSGIFRNVFTLDLKGPDHPIASLAGGTVTSLPSSMTFEFPLDTNMSSVQISDFVATGTGSCSGASVTGLSKTGHVATLLIDSSACSSGDVLSIKAVMAGISDPLGNAGTGEKVVTFILDTTGPNLPVLSPTSATVSKIPTSLSVTFSTDTDMSSVSLSDFSISNNGSCALNLSGLVKTGRTAVVTLTSSGCTHGDEVTFSINGTSITDSIGNAGSGTAQVVYKLDTQGISSSGISFLPANATLAVLPASITLSFPSDTDMDSISITDFSTMTTGLCATNLLTGITKSGTNVTLNLNTVGCLSGSSIAVDLDVTKVSDLSGNVGAGSVHMAYTLDNIGPQSALFGVTGGIVSEIPSTINVTFSPDTAMSSVSDADFTISGTGPCAASTIASVSKLSQVGTLALNASSCAHGDTLTVTLWMAGVTDAIGNAGVGNAIVTYTIDSTGPSMASVNLSSGIVSSIASSIVYTFSSDTSMASVDASDFSALGTGGCMLNPITGLTKSGQTATLSLSGAGCANGNEISVSLSMNGVTDALGNAGSGTLTRTFTLDNVGPSLATLSTPGGAMMALPDSVVFTFSSDTDMNSVTATDFTGVGSATCPASAISSFSKSGQTATINFNRTGCVHGGKIALTLNMALVTDAYGNAGAGTVSATYVLDTTGPANPTVNLVQGLYVIMPSSVIYTFASDVDMTTVSGADFVATGTGACVGNPISSVNVVGNTVTVNLNVVSCGLLNTVRIDVLMTGIKDQTGNPGTGYFRQEYTRVLSL